MQQGLLEKLTVPWLLKNFFPAFYETRRFITVFTNNPPPFPFLAKMNTVNAFPHYICNTQFNIIIPSMPRSSKWMLNNSYDGLYSELLSLWTFSIVRCKKSINSIILIVKVVSLLQVYPKKPCTHLPSPHTCHTLRPSHPP
jgi:hypothetical protein